ncbi:MAG: PD-(D/E)XK nuclease family protein [Deltaproteobacteria bacterium]|nr:PD-(D/E)XK nuclease family protein [Deltaproteobacteria bacterium]
MAAAVDWFAAWLPASTDDITSAATVLCSSARAHALRRALAHERQETGRLAGVRFLEAAALARELLARSGQVREPGWEMVRRLRIHQCFDSGALRDRLRYFDANQLRSGRGYADAFARVIADLDSSGLSAAMTEQAARDLSATDALSARRLHDVAAVWAAADLDLAARRSTARLLVEAATVVRAAPLLAAPFGRVAAFVTSSPTATLLQFLSALPACSVLFLDARPLRAGTQRWRQLITSTPAISTGTALLPRAATRPGPQTPRSSSRGAPGPQQLALPLGEVERLSVNELALVRQFAFAPAELVANPDRPRSNGPDGSVDLEEYPAIEDEVEAAALWVGEQIALGTPLESIAVIVPALDPHARLLLDRLARLGTAAPQTASAEGEAQARNLWSSDTVPAYVAGGVPLRDTAAGLRLSALLHALLAGLETEAMIPVVRALRRSDDEPRRLSPSRVAEIVYGAGIVGGSPGDAAGALEWLPRLQRRRACLQRLLAELPATPTGEAEKRQHLYTRRESERWLAEVEPLLPALAALQQLAAMAIDGTGLRRLWPATQEFFTTHLRVPPQPEDCLAILSEAVAPVLADAVADAVCGFAALAYLLEALRSTRVPYGRFGEARLFIGTAAAAAGIAFRATRILGLAEGIVPRTPHDDPIVPNEVRMLLEEQLRREHPQVVIPRLEDSVLEDVHAFVRVVSGTSQRLALSVARQWVDRSEREVSGMMLEIAAALARRPQSPSDGDVPNAARLRADYFSPGRGARRTYAARAAQARALLSCAPHSTGSAWRVPAGWCTGAATRLDRTRALAAADNGALSITAATWSALPVPGLSAARPISASALTTLLQCPHRFLLQYVLHLDQPARRPSTDTIAADAYGSLFHATAEAFFRAHGAAVCAREGSLEHWRDRAREIASEKFAAWGDEYPLRGHDAVAREEQRLRQQLALLAEIEWRMPRRTFGDTEMPFGDPEPIPLALPGGALYVTGQIDRVDRLPDSTWSVRDLKTGRLHDLIEEPLNPTRDLQIGLYTLVMDRHSPPMRVSHAAYVHPQAGHEPERAFEHSLLKQLRVQTGEWLGVARGLLAAGVFPRTTQVSDCSYCPLRSACGDGAPGRGAAELLAAPLSPELAAFIQLRQQGPDDEGDR